MKRLCCTFLLLSALQLHGTQNKDELPQNENLPGRLEEMCKDKKDCMAESYCNDLRTFFYLTRILNSPERTKELEEYGRSVAGFSVQEGLPKDWAVAFFINNLCKELKKSPQETGASILEAKEALLKLAGKKEFP